jgi:Peptidase family M28/PA domain
MRIMSLGAAVVAAVLAGSAVRAQTEFSGDRFRAHVTFLADDVLEGREAGTRGHEIAARYIASQFALLGVGPGASGGTYFETVNLQEARVTGANPTLTLTGPNGKQTLKQRETVMIQGSIAGGAVKLNAPLVFVGYGMKDAAVGFDDYEGLDVRGKIAVVLGSSPKDMDSEVGAHLRSEQSRVAAEHGAVGMIVVQTHATAAAFTWDRIVEFRSEPLTTWVRSDGTPFDPAYGMKAAVAIKPNAAAALFDRSPVTLDQILTEADRPGGRPRGFPLKSTAEISVAMTMRRYSSPEVVGRMEGSDPGLKDEFVVLMAHADHIGINGGSTGDRINNGALDNAAGIATLLEVARAFANAAQRPRRSILLVANTAEEKGLLGAEFFAHYPTVPIERIAAAIDLDMPLLLYDFTDVIAFGASHSTMADVIRRAGAAMGVKLSPDPMPEQAIFVRSDHYAMVKAGVPAVMLATGMANGGQAAWSKYLESNYHKPSDDVSQPINWAAGAKFADLNYRVVRTLADAQTRPQWYAQDYFGDLYAVKAPKVEKPGR